MFISKITICNLFAYYGKVEVEFKKCEEKTFIAFMAIMALVRRALSAVRNYFFWALV